MSLYNLINGVNPLAGLCLSMLNLKPGDVPRFRDCYLAKAEGESAVEIHLYTRMGGGNRGHENWVRNGQIEALNSRRGVDCTCEGCRAEALSKHPLYLRDQDNDHDRTYATYTFKVPDALREDVEHLVELNPSAVPESPEKRFHDFIERLKTRGNEDADVRRVSEAMAPVFDAISGLKE